ncbi:kinase-like domain-containing protein [Chytridium lagenaria]|nr:kinase-like domain-containing protein [Chytridium lagenaria]
MFEEKRRTLKTVSFESEVCSETALPFLGKCKNVDEAYEKLERVGEGTYGIVYKAKQRSTGEIAALKKMRNENEREGLPISSLREIALLKTLQHENIVRVTEIAVGSQFGNMKAFMEYCENDLATIMDSILATLQVKTFMPAEIKCLMLQLLKGLEFLHDNYIIHRDLKMSNLLLNSYGVLKIADFGMARKTGQPSRPMTPRVVTLWYRAPELLLGSKDYTCAVDMWSVGCIFGELIKCSPLLPGKTEANQMDLTCNLLGAPNEKIWPQMKSLPLANSFRYPKQNFSNVRSVLKSGTPASLDLFNDLLLYDPLRRIDVKASLRHAYFRREGPNPCTTTALSKRLTFRDTGIKRTAAARRRDDGEKDERRVKRRTEAEEDLDLGVPPHKVFTDDVVGNWA